MPDTVIALDLGSTKIAVLVGRIKGEDIEILGFSLVPSQGIKYGSIVDINSASNCIIEAIRRAERMAGIKLEPRVFVGIGNDQMATLSSRGMVIVKNRNQEINKQDVERTIESAKATPLPPNREIIYAISREFSVDGQDNIENPIGLVGTRLEADVLLVTFDKTQLKNIVNTIEKANLEVEGFVPKNIAASEAVLSPQQKNLGVALADIGGDLSNLTVYREGSIISTGVLRLGGERITKDLAIGLRITMEEAEKAKKTIGSLKEDKDDSLEVISLQGNKITINSSQVRNYMQPRVEEILEFIEKKLSDLNYPLALLPGGLVVTGGTALLDGFEEFAGKYLDVPVKKGFPLILSQYMPEESTYFYSVAMGILLRVKEDRLNLEKRTSLIVSIKDTLRNILKPFRDVYI